MNFVIFNLITFKYVLHSKLIVQTVDNVSITVVTLALDSNKMTIFLIMPGIIFWITSGRSA